MKVTLNWPSSRFRVRLPVQITQISDEAYFLRFFRNCSMLMDASYPSSNGGRILILLESTVMIAPEPKTSP